MISNGHKTNRRNRFYGMMETISAVCFGFTIVACSGNEQNSSYPRNQFRASEIVPFQAEQFIIRYSADSLHIEYIVRNGLTFPVSFTPTLVAMFDGDSTKHVWGYDYDEFATELCLSRNGRKLENSWAESARFPYPNTLDYQFITVLPKNSATVRYSIPMDNAIYRMLTERNQADISIALWRANDIQHVLRMSDVIQDGAPSNVELNVRCCWAEIDEDIAFAAKTSQSIPHIVLSENDVYDLKDLIRYRIRASGRVTRQE